ncbi:MAG: DUF6198 family protein [Lachnospiraceae bacterium]|nr:DUF6198 family protein [Lachnospiraceae bacterium]
MKPITLRQYLLFGVGTLFNALGISILTKAYLGTSPISSLPFVLSLGLPLSFGVFTFLFNMLFLIGQLLILRKKFPPIQFLQIPVTIAFSLFLDLLRYLFRSIKPDNYLLSLVLLLTGCAVMAFGIVLSIRAEFLMTPADAFVRALSGLHGYSFGRVKVVFDTALMVLAVICSFSLFGTFRGVREGTLMSSILVGNLITFYQYILPKLFPKF